MKIFLAVADCGNFSQAARSQGVSQPAVSQCIAQLEAEVGAPLLLRGRSGTSLTPMGETLASYARRILALYDEMGECLQTGSPARQSAEFDLPDGHRAEICMEDGKLKIGLK
ncbi:MAG: LysR family transcriptional regulator [Bacteroidales bacterium]|nr:LysR family transcriptional regulator [Bacteroidales bacterium]